MSIASDRSARLFEKMERDSRRIASDRNPDTVHAFRTTSRRLQTLLEDLLPERTRNQKKLLQSLKRIRKRAGKLRDVDVQLAALRSLKTSQEPRRKTRLTHSLIELRVKQEKKLVKLLKKSDIREIQKRLQRASKEVGLQPAKDPLSVARNMVESVVQSENVPDEVALHLHRLAVKRGRYAAELAAPSNESAQFIGQLRKMQDALGHWHDWNTLTRTAAEHFGEVNHSSLVAALQNVTRGKFRLAIASLPSAMATPTRKVIPATQQFLSAQSAA